MQKEGQERRENVDQIRKKRHDKKMGLAERDDTQVQYVRTEESKALMKIQAAMDFALFRLRQKGGLDPRYSMEKMTAYMKKYRDILVNMDKLTTELCQLMDVEYRRPRVLRDEDETKASGSAETGSPVAEAAAEAGAKAEAEAGAERVVPLPDAAPASPRKAKKAEAGG